MISSIRSWPIARQIALLIAAALLLLTAGNMVVTFVGPPPRAAPMRLDDLAALINGQTDGPPFRQVTWDKATDRFAERPGEVRRVQAEARLAALLSRPLEEIRFATTLALRSRPGPRRSADHIEGGFSIGVRAENGKWRILRSKPEPLFSAWHRTTLAITLALAIVLAFIASAISKGIVQPIRRLSVQADQAFQDGAGSTISAEGPAEVAHLAGTVAAMRDRFTALMESRTMMLAAIAHDMASPLARLQFHVAKLPVRARGDAEADLDELSAMISSILDFAKGQQGLTMEPVDLAALARDVIARRDRSGTQLAIDPAPREAWVEGDRIALARLIDNLASNAQRYADGGLIEIEIGSNDVRLTLSDEGPGFDDALAERLFDPFFRVEGSRNRETAGTGLGLATARAIADAHGGTLTARNRNVRGAAFVLTLPSLREPLHPVGPAERAG